MDMHRPSPLCTKQDDHSQPKNICRVLLRGHGDDPSSYAIQQQHSLQQPRSGLFGNGINGNIGRPQRQRAVTSISLNWQRQEVPLAARGSGSTGVAASAAAATTATTAATKHQSRQRQAASTLTATTTISALILRPAIAKGWLVKNASKDDSFCSGCV
jgi:hypothetical protein